MDKFLKWAVLVVAVGATIRAVRDVYVGQQKALVHIPPGHHMHPGGMIMRDDEMPAHKKPCCSGCATGKGCGSH